MPNVLKTEGVIISMSEGVEENKCDVAEADTRFFFVGSYSAICRQT